jgi:hypothetical protein
MSIRDDIARTIEAVRRAPYRSRHDAAWRVLEKIDRMEVTPTADEEVFRIRVMVARALREEGRKP